MKNLTLQAIITLSIFAFLSSGFMSSSGSAMPVQDKEDLEKMIMKRIEERKKELAEERAKNGESADDKDESSSKSRPRVSPSTRKTAKAVKDLGNAKIETADSASKTPPPRVRNTEPKVAEYTKPTVMSNSTKPIDPNVKIQFNFNGVEWGEIIQWFADELGYGIFMGHTGPPQGTYTCSEPEMNLLEALDYLNSRLGILDPPHVLIRNGNQLVLVNESGSYPQPLVAIVRPEDLKNYGKFEVVRCIFDLENLDGEVLHSQIRELVSDTHIDGFSYIQAANRMEVRERVMVLREFNNIIQRALQKEIEITTLTFEPKHVEPEVLLLTFRQMVGIPEGQFENEDGSLRFSVQPLGTKIFLTGSPNRINEFKRIAEIIDIPFPNDVDGLQEKPYLKTHSVSGDIEVVFQVVQTLLEGEPNVKLDKDVVTGNLYLWAPKSVQENISNSLMEMAGGVSFSIIPVENIRPGDAVKTIETLLDIDPFSENPTGPKLVDDPENDSVMIHGTPQEIVLVRKMIEEIDQNSDVTKGPRRPSRFIETNSSRDKERVTEFLQIPGILETMGQKNRLKLILPSERGTSRGRFRGRLPVEQESEGSQLRDPGSRNDVDTTSTTTIHVGGLRNYLASTYGGQESDDTDRIGNTTQSAPDEPASVPGAPVEVRVTDQGIMIYSEDLDAADVLESKILDMLDSDGTAELPAFYLIKHRKVGEVKGVIEHVCGLQSSGGGGGGAGGLGGLIGGAVQNAVGGAAGDALGGLLGGGGGSAFGPDSAGAFELEGEDVRIGTDVRLNYLIVSGATSNDLDFIEEIIDIIDVDSPPIPPKDIGKTYVIPVVNRDPMYVKEKIMEMLSERFKSTGNNANTGRQANAEQQIQQAVLRQLQGGRNRRGNNAAGGNGSTSEQPKATLGVDEERGTILVTGPKFIYQEVYDLVMELDKKQERDLLIVPLKLDATHIANYLHDLYPNQIEIVTNDEENGVGGGTGGASSGRSSGSNRGTGRSSAGSRNSGGSSRNANRSAIERSIQNAIRSRGGGR